MFKVSIWLLVLVVALGFIGCSKEENKEEESKTGVETKTEVGLTPPAIQGVAVPPGAVVTIKVKVSGDQISWDGDKASIVVVVEASPQGPAVPWVLVCLTGDNCISSPVTYGKASQGTVPTNPSPPPLKKDVQYIAEVIRKKGNSGELGYLYFKL